MAEKILDCRGLACPAPVLQAKEIVDQGGVERLIVLVDNEAAQENVSRFLNRAGFTVKVESTPEGRRIIGEVPGEAATPAAPVAADKGEQKILIVIGTDRLGRGDDFLGERLLLNFLGTLKEIGPELWTLVFLNAGVKLTCRGTPVLADLQELAARGVNLLVCGTCLNHFQLLEQKQLGETTNMLDIVTHMQLADKVITIT